VEGDRKWNEGEMRMYGDMHKEVHNHDHNGQAQKIDISDFPSNDSD
jgi:hypothetical protein